MRTDSYEVLIRTLQETSDHAERDRTALALVDLGNIDCIHLLIRLIESPSTENHRSTLIYACSEFDCSAFIVEFARIWLYSPDEMDIELIEVFAGMGSISSEDASIVVKMFQRLLTDSGLNKWKREKTSKIIHHLTLAGKGR